MTKTAAQATLSPYRLSMGNGIYLEDAVSIVEMQNYAYGHSSGLHLSATTAPLGWGSTGNELATHNAFFPSATLPVPTHYHFYSWLDADVVNLAIEGKATIASGHSCEVHFDIGAAARETLTFGVGTTTETATIATSSTGTGWILIKIHLEHVSGGASTANKLLSLLIEDEPQTTATSIRDPEL